MTLSTWRRTGALTALSGLLAGGLVAGVAAPAQAADETPAITGAAWLADQPTNGLLTYEGWFGPDYGLSIDALLALNAVGTEQDTVDDIAAAIGANVEAYTDYSYTMPVDPDGPEGPEGPVDHVHSGRSAQGTAKALVSLQAAGVDVTEIDPDGAGDDEKGPAGDVNDGDINLITRLEALTRDDTGRIVDDAQVDGVFAPSENYAATIGQSFAARALGAANSPEATKAITYLLAQQCAAGFFRAQPTSPDPDSGATETCAAASSPTGDVDASALALLALADLLDKDDQPVVVPLYTQIATAGDKAAAWLKTQQAAAGSFVSDSGPNANSTGLAGWALGAWGAVRATTAHDAAAGRAAVWLRRHQLVNAGPCTTFAAADRGAIALDDLDLADAKNGPIAAADLGRYLRASAQAIPALNYSPEPTQANGVTLPAFARTGTKTVVATARGAAPGDSICLVNGASTNLVAGSASGSASFGVALPAAGVRTVQAYDSTGLLGSAKVTVLGRKVLTLKFAKKVRKGKKQTVKVRGLAAGESVVVKVNGKRVKAGRANASGVFTATFKQTKVGKKRLLVTGQYADLRFAKKTFKVVR
ncbi:hypothetical protein [Nocardioides sp. SYSU D00038]|uniref:hypothetical protein n=1 Tax=Nocardioides sp. SYSU D00038 TaxID=2812554 RepID=UPI0019686B5E|nr:hypothetical protein [Nocardioides sp. SYSU D00038]